MKLLSLGKEKQVNREIHEIREKPTPFSRKISRFAYLAYFAVQKNSLSCPSCHPVKKSRSERGFTMIEIALAIGIIGFALCAIIGILPHGMNVQKDNREDTIISQDAPYFLNAIRNGEMRTNFGVFSNYVESITLTNINPSGTNVTVYGNPFFTNGSGVLPFLTNDMNIVGLFSTPEYDARFPNPGQTNLVSGIVRAMTGSAIQQNGLNSFTAFRYQLTVDNVPWNSIAYDSTNWSPYSLGTPDYITRHNRFLEVAYLTNNLHEVRLKFAWPVLPNGNLGPGRQTYRSLVSGHLLLTTNYFNGNLMTNWFFQPQSYTNYTYAF
jgi:hypothetical protein